MGYVVGAFSGVTLATIAIFLPVFVFVVPIVIFVTTLRIRPILGLLLEGLYVADVGLTATVTITCSAPRLSICGPRRSPFSRLPRYSVGYSTRPGLSRLADCTERSAGCSLDHHSPVRLP